MSDYYDILMEGGFYTADLTEEQFLQNQDKAYEMYRSGEKCNFSKGISGEITAGYGSLGNYGCWEFPLIVNQGTLEIDLVLEIHNEF